jgi:hypothetical protein
MSARSFVGFASWPDVLAHVRAGRATWYQAPLDARPVRVRVRLVGSRSVRVEPPSTDADPFVANVDHLSRFKREERA